MSHNKSRKYAKNEKKQNLKWLPILAVVGGLVLISMSFFALRQNSTPSAQIEVKGSPSLKVDKDQVDLGNVKLGQTVQVSFQLTNVGDQMLRFNKQPYVEVVEGC